MRGSRVCRARPRLPRGVAKLGIEGPFGPCSWGTFEYYLAGRAGRLGVELLIELRRAGSRPANRLIHSLLLSLPVSSASMLRLVGAASPELIWIYGDDLDALIATGRVIDSAGYDAVVIDDDEQATADLGLLTACASRPASIGDSAIPGHPLAL